MEKVLTRLSEKCLSYGGRIQLVNWVIMGKYTYWSLGTILPTLKVNKEDSLLIHFSFGMVGRRYHGGKYAFPRRKDVLGWETSHSSLITKALSLQGGLRRGTLDLIQIRPSVNSALWKDLMLQKEEILEILDCGANNNLVWKRGKPCNTLGDIVQCITTP